MQRCALILNIILLSLKSYFRLNKLVNKGHQDIIVRANDKEFFPLVSKPFLRFLLYTLVWLVGVGFTIGPAWAVVNYFISK